jgi:ribosome maturation factor RimP
VFDIRLVKLVRQEELTRMLAPVISGLGLECVGVELAGGTGNGLVRVYIDAPDRPVTVDDCETVSREIGAVLDLENPIVGRYTLEVSSPGLDRPLFTPAQFARFIGETAKVTLNVPMDGRRRFQGPIRAADGDRIVIDQDGTEVSIEHGNVLKANLVPQWNESGRKPGRSARK